jgi:hypothetical protein
MPNLIQSLQGRDQGHLRIIAELWGIKLEEQETQKAVRSLATSLSDADRVAQIISNLPPEAKDALEELLKSDGRVPWAQFTRTYGEVREMGTAKRDRERPYEHTASAMEVLWYRALVARAFFDTPKGPQELAYVPDDMLVLLSKAEDLKKQFIGRPASAPEYAHVSLVSDYILDHTCTALAALRIGMSPTDSFPFPVGEALSGKFIQSLLLTSGLLDEAGLPKPDPTRKFLEAKRGDALVQLFIAWMESKLINELGLLPGLVLEGNWINDPRRTRLTILEYLGKLPETTWWSLGSFISGIKQHNPDFQRPAGDYDSWFIRSEASGKYLRGFEYWDEVDARLIIYILTGPLHWFGVLDLGCLEETDQVTAFRLSRWSAALLQGKPPDKLPVEGEKLIVRSDARLGARRLVPRSVRYQVARFCDWQKETPDEYQYQISSTSLSRARKQGLKVNQLMAILNHHAKVVPPSLVKALERWDKHGSEARLERMVVLRVASVEIMQVLRKSRASRFLGESLGPTTVMVNPGAIDKVLGILAELGYLGDIRGEVE